MSPRRSEGSPHEGAEAPVRVLVAEDDAEMLDLLRGVLVEEGYEVSLAQNGHEALAAVEAGGFDLLVTDVRMPGPDGIEVLRRAMARRLHQPVILMTAFGSIDSAVEAMRAGAYHYLAKPFDLDELLRILAGAAEQIRELRTRESQHEADGDPLFPIVFRSAAMSGLLRLAREVASSSATVLIQGSSGTGKELLARGIHRMSGRHRGPFVAVDCNAIPETLLESELFGHRRGAFTGAVADRVGIIEEADGGTLFLDEVGNLTAAVQGKLLRFLQERRFRRVGDSRETAVDVRVISASNQDLRAAVARGELREDLYYRISVIPVEIPDLKERREDIPPLIYHFVRRFNADGAYAVEGVSREALDCLLAYAWPGNVRQLENVVERAVILRKAGLIRPRDLPAEVTGTDTTVAAGLSLEEMERRHIEQLLRENHGNQSRVARILGINRRTLYRRLKRYEQTFDVRRDSGDAPR